MDEEKLKHFVQRMDALHEGTKSCRPLSKNSSWVGLKGQAEFADRYSLPIDTVLRPCGDRGIDFYTPIGTFDVKTARKPGNLAVEVGKVNSDIYVLAGYSDNPEEVWFVGWEYASVLLECRQGCFPGYNILNHLQPANNLRPMEELDELFSIMGSPEDWEL